MCKCGELKLYFYPPAGGCKNREHRAQRKEVMRFRARGHDIYTRCISGNQSGESKAQAARASLRDWTDLTDSCTWTLNDRAMGFPRQR